MVSLCFTEQFMNTLGESRLWSANQPYKTETSGTEPISFEADPMSYNDNESIPESMASI